MSGEWLPLSNLVVRACGLIIYSCIWYVLFPLFTSWFTLTEAWISTWQCTFLWILLDSPPMLELPVWSWLDIHRCGKTLTGWDLGVEKLNPGRFLCCRNNQNRQCFYFIFSHRGSTFSFLRIFTLTWYLIKVVHICPELLLRHCYTVTIFQNSISSQLEKCAVYFALHSVVLSLSSSRI